ncbi:MAG: tripartite tricarboxylate transporter substrate binding protein [Burkholderiales bacterium]|nr:tripartite tricarboxylate transporter substrate binding protein [Burkholderiales bacterium]
MNAFFAAFLAVAAALANGHALAQAWPAGKPIRVVVNFPPGGAADVIARAIAPQLSEALSQQLVIENRPGAGGNIGADVVAKSPADGYTLLMASGGTVSINPHLYPSMPFDAQKDIVPVAAAARVLVFLVVRPEIPARTVAEFIAHARANPGRLSFGSPGNGSSPHIATEMFKAATKTFMVHIPYRGGAPALTDLLGGQLDFMFDPGIGLQHVRSGKLRLLAVGSPRRSPLFPDAPTVAESGMPGFDADSWFGFYAPGGTSAEIIGRLNREINRILGTAAVRERIVALGGEPAPMSPAEFAERARIDRERFGVIIKAQGIKPD